MTIAAAAPADLTAVQDLTRRAYERYIPIIGAEPVPMREDYAPRIAAGEVWLLRDEPIVAGLIVLEEEDDALLIFSVAIAPEAQGQGLGQRLLAFADDQARARGFQILRLYTNARMERNIGIYRRAGFRETGRRPHPAIPGSTIVDMEKVIVPAETWKA